MKEQLVSFEVAELAKEKGFNEICIDTYRIKTKQLSNRYSIDFSEIDPDDDSDCNEEILKNEFEVTNSTLNTNYGILAPTQSLLQKWLREKHSIIVSINPQCEFYNYDNIVRYDFGYDIIIHYNNEMVNNDIDGNTYEKALEKGLQEALKLIE